MSSMKLNIDKMPAPWNKVFDIAEVLPNDSWLLVGGLMVQAHARLVGLESRATTDIDMLINVMASNSNTTKVVMADAAITLTGKLQERNEPYLKTS